MMSEPGKQGRRSSLRTALAAVLAGLTVPLGLIAALFALVAVNDRTANAALNASGGLAAAFLVSAVATGLIAQSLGIARPLRWGAIAGMVTAALPLGLIGSLNGMDILRGGPAEAGQEVIAALEAESHALARVAPGPDTRDLEPFREAWAGRRIVALGESTHGTSEFFLMKHRLVEFLVTELGFRHFAMETHPERHGPLLDDYIQGGDTAAESVLYWPWATVEYVAMLDWMRAYNEGREGGDRIVFHGIDPQAGDRDRGMAENVAALVESVGPEGRVIVWAANSHVRGALGGMGEYLKAGFGDEVYLLGLEFHEGEFTSRTRTIHTYRGGPFGPSYYSHALAQLPGSIRFIDFESASRRPDLRAWLAEPRVSNHLFEMYAITRFLRPIRRVREPWIHLFDGVVFIEASTPATPLRNSPRL